MFRPMRRSLQALSVKESSTILTDCSSGVLALLGDDDYPYALPLSYFWCPEQNRIYFHCAKAGHKLDAIARCDKASFCVVAEDNVLPAEYSTNYRSAIAFGRIRIVADDAEKHSAIVGLAHKYAPQNSEETLRAAISRDYAHCHILALDLEHLSGKAARKLTQALQGNE